MSEKVRNIVQSAQEREIVKTAPDMVVYIDGLPFVLNPFLATSKKDLQAVNFNDYVTTVSTSYSIDSMIPTGNITLSIPNGLKHLFMAPGGELVFETMMSVRIYAKCYFFSKKGNTVFRRIFNGLIRAISVSETQTSMEIGLSLAGIMRLLEILQIETKPSVAGSPSLSAVVEKSTQGKLDLYTAIYETIQRPLDFSEFVKHSLLQQQVQDTKQAGAIQQEYVARWTTRLQDLRRDVRIFGGRVKGIGEAKTQSTPQKQVKGAGEDPATKDSPLPPKNSESTESTENSEFIQKTRDYMFDFSVSGIPLLGGSLVTRLDRVRQLTDIAGLECYQDIDGLFIVKPPLYNLDCTMMGEESAKTSSSAKDELTDENLYEGANPYIVHMAEVLSENYSEDEGGLRATSIVIAPNFANPQSLQLEGQIQLSNCVRYIDMNLLRQFGVREAPPKYAGFLPPDKPFTMAYAISELNRANRGFRTYNVTIPLRPELRLGFPIYLPHKDMYAYTVQASMNYTVGGQATMSLTCNYIRKRPLVPRKQTVGSDATSSEEAYNANQSEEAIAYTSQPNLIMYWKAPLASNTPSAKETAPSAMEGRAVSQNILPSEDPSPQQTAVTIFKRYKHANLFETKTDTVGSWVVAVDDAGKVAKVGPATENGPFFDAVYKNGKKTKPIKADGRYMEICMTAQPYTDEKGYEVVSCLPWGRYSTLRQAITDCTRNYWYTDSSTIKEKELKTLQTSNAFLMAGLVTPGWTNAADVLKNLQETKSKIQEEELQSGFPGTSGSTDTTGIAQTRTNQIEQTAGEFAKFEKSNVISFELSYTPDAFGKTEASFPTEDKSDYSNLTQMYEINPGLGKEGNQSEGMVNAVNVFLNGFMEDVMSSGMGKYAVSTLPQNTDIGGYRYFGGPFSGVIGSVRAQFEMGPWSELFDMGRSGKAYFTSGNESRANRTW